VQGHTLSKISRKEKLGHSHQMTGIFNFQESRVSTNLTYSWGFFVFYAYTLFTPRPVRLGPN